MEYHTGPDGLPVRSTLTAPCGVTDCDHVAIRLDDDHVLRCGTHSWDRRVALTLSGASC